MQHHQPLMGLLRAQIIIADKEQNKRQPTPKEELLPEVWRTTPKEITRRAQNVLKNKAGHIFLAKSEMSFSQMITTPHVER